MENRQSDRNGRTQSETDLRRNVRMRIGWRSLDSTVDPSDRAEPAVAVSVAHHSRTAGTERGKCGTGDRIKSEVESTTSAALAVHDRRSGRSAVTGRMRRGCTERMSETFTRSNLAFNGQQQHSIGIAAGVQSK